MITLLTGTHKHCYTAETLTSASKLETARSKNVSNLISTSSVSALSEVEMAHDEVCRPRFLGYNANDKSLLGICRSIVRKHPIEHYRFCSSATTIRFRRKLHLSSAG